MYIEAFEHNRKQNILTKIPREKYGTSQVFLILIQTLHIFV